MLKVQSSGSVPACVVSERRCGDVSDIQAEIEAHNDVFRSVEGNKMKMVKALGSSEEAVFLQQRLDDMNQRWNDLKAKSANIRAHLEASAERWNRLLSVLEELGRWISVKDEELNKQMPIGGDVPTVLQQQTHCTLSPVSSHLNFTFLSQI
ncbi:Utrophin [Labeo rohita]|uniref:Utrophin n=1 Tax=Labeo rohita TaxID=84645 RepID=A0ABQ8LH40_LABRO|nr:Utrophin [Labeo rohita]